MFSHQNEVGLLNCFYQVVFHTKMKREQVFRLTRNSNSFTLKITTRNTEIWTWIGRLVWPALSSYKDLWCFMSYLCLYAFGSKAAQKYMYRLFDVTFWVFVKKGLMHEGCVGRTLYASMNWFVGTLSRYEPSAFVWMCTILSTVFNRNDWVRTHHKRLQELIFECRNSVFLFRQGFRLLLISRW